MRLALVLTMALLTAACSRPDNASGAGGVSAGEARALDDAAEMLQNQQLPTVAIPPAKIPPPQQQIPSKKPAATPVKPAG
jgi:hypothetical protein